MYAKYTLTACLVLISSLCAADTTLNQAQASKLEADLSSYKASVTANPSVESLLSAITSVLGPSRISSIAAAQTSQTIVDVVSWAEHPSSVAALEPTAWESALPTSLRNQYNQLVTSQFVAEASIIRQDLGMGNSAAGRGVGVAGVVGGVVAAGVAVGMVML